MKKIVLMLVLATIFIQCTETPTSSSMPTNSLAAFPVKTVTLKGQYQKAAQGFLLLECSSRRMYQVTDKTRILDSLYKEAIQPAPYPNEPVYAVLTGTIGAAADDSLFTATRVDTLRPLDRFNPCIPYEFWCSGTEPFWSLRISETDGGIFLKNMADEKGEAFFWKSPKSDGKTSWTYQTSTMPPQADQPMQVLIRKQKCNDGMSDLRFDYSAEVSVNGKVLRGCAVRKGERQPKEGSD